MLNETKELIVHPDRQGLAMVLGELEANIMDLIWRESPDAWITVRDVYEKMRLERYIAYTTVMNTMTRLAKKGVLETTRCDQAYLYRPRQSRESFIHDVVGHVLERLLVQFTGSTHAVLIDYAQQHPQQQAKLAQFLDEVGRRRSGTAPSTEDGG